MMEPQIDIDPLIFIKEESFMTPQQQLIPPQEDYSTILSQIPSIDTETDDIIEFGDVKIVPPTPSRPPKPSDSVDRSCLFCLKFAPKEMKEFQWKIPGAGIGCPLMQKHLQTIFILHKLLDLPSSWSEGILSRGDALPPVQYWLRVCAKCFPQIETAWGLHQQLMAIQEKIDEIKVRLKNKIFRKRQSGSGRGCDRDLMSEIRESVSGSEVILSHRHQPHPEKKIVTSGKRKKKINEDVKDFRNDDVNEFNSPDNEIKKPVSGSEVIPSPRILPKRNTKNEVKEDFRNFEDLQFELDDDDNDGGDNFHGPEEDDPDWEMEQPESHHKKVTNDNPSSKEAGDEDEDDEAKLLRLRMARRKVTHLKNYKRLTKSSPFWGKIDKRRRIRPPPKDNPELLLDEEAAQKELERLRKLRKKVTHLSYYKPIIPVKPRDESKPKRKRIRVRGKQISFPLYPLRCEKCPTKYAEGQEELLKEHMNAHERCLYGNNEFICKRCKFPCETEEELEAHKKRRHPALTEKKCPHEGCSFVTFQQNKMQKHLDAAKHSDTPRTLPPEEKLICSVCQLKSGSIQALGRHKRTEHPEIFGKKLETGIECDQCGLKFDNAILLEGHKKSHKRQEMPDDFFCEVCGKGFKKKHRLQAHMVCHDEKGQFMCALCGIDFHHKHQLTRHQQTYHPETVDPARMNPKFKLKRKSDVDIVKCKICHLEMPVALRRRHMKIHEDRPYKCDECDRSYFKPQGLRKHKEINHSNGATNVNCPYCNKEFIHPEYLRWHYKYCRMKKSLEVNKSSIKPEVNALQQHQGQPQQSSSSQCESVMNEVDFSGI